MVLALVACGPRIPAGLGNAETEPEPYPTVLTAPSELAGDFAMQQNVTMRHPRGEHSFPAVLQKQGDTLTLVVLGPHGGRAMTLTQVGDAITTEMHVDEELPFPPEYILHDVHRVWFARVNQAETDGEEIEEIIENGRVMARRFERDDKEGAIVVTYDGGLTEGAPLTTAPPERVVLESGWFGYTAEITTSGWQAI